MSPPVRRPARGVVALVAVAAYGAVSGAAGLPLDYSNANALIAAWVLAGR